MMFLEAALFIDYGKRMLRLKPDRKEKTKQIYFSFFTVFFHQNECLCIYGPVLMDEVYIEAIFGQQNPLLM